MKKINIRTGVFETNSSSSHSICIPEEINDELFDTIIPNDEGIIELEGGEFGWAQDEFDDALTKANYMAVYCSTRYNEDKINDKLLRDILIDTIKKQTNCADVVFTFENDEKSYVYIDHQSVESKDYHWLFEDEELMRVFIFNKDSILITDNDNH